MNISEILKKHSKNTGKLVNAFVFKSPLGNIISCADQDFLYLVCFEDSKNIDKMVTTVSKKLSCKFIEEKNEILKKFEYEIQEYLDGKLKKFTVPIKTFGSEFQNVSGSKPYNGLTQVTQDFYEDPFKKVIQQWVSTDSDDDDVVFNKVEVWDSLMEIPYGTTQTYGTLAKVMGRPASHSRAVGAACGANAHLLVIPCHRLVATGSKGGFSCGVDRKEWLIHHEKEFA